MKSGQQAVTAQTVEMQRGGRMTMPTTAIPCQSRCCGSKVILGEGLFANPGRENVPNAECWAARMDVEVVDGGWGRDGPAAARSERSARKGAATRQGQPGLRGEAE